VALLCGSLIYSQTPLPSNTIVTENFNGIGNTATTSLPVNWKMSSAGTGLSSGWTTGTNVTTTTIAANSGTPATGGRYNWATTSGTDRAIGFLASASYVSPNAIMAHYRNTTGGSVSSVSIAYSIERYLVNTAVPTVELYYSTDGSVWTLVSSASTLSGDFPAGAAAGSFASPKTIGKTATVNVSLANNGDIYFKWVFASANAAGQGLGLDDVSVFAGNATPVLIAKLRDLLQIDNGQQNQFNDGDVIRYHTVIKNIGTGQANNVQINIPPPSNTTLVPGSIKTSAVAVEDNYAASFNTALSASSVLVNDFGVPLPTAILSYGSTADSTATAPGVARTTDAGGTITLLANGTFSYTPPTGFSGIDRFKYITGNGNLPNNDAVVNISVAGDITIATSKTDPLCNGGSSGTITVNASGGNGTLTYSSNGSGGPYQASNVFNGLAAGTYTIAVKDAGGYIKTTTVTLTDPALLVVNSTVPQITYNTAMATATFTRTGGTGSVSWSATGLPSGVSISASTGDVTGTPMQTGSFNAVITATDANGCTATKNVTVAVGPKLTNDSYTSVVGNTQLVADGHSTPTTPYTTSATNIIANDISDAAITVTAVTDALTTAGGRITISANGKFIYSPGAGSTAADSYTYTASSNGVSSTGTINFTIANMVWYVNNTYGGANGASLGTSHRPFTTVNAAASASAVNQIIYVHTGTGNTTGDALLKSGQTLRGAGSALSIGTLSIAAGTKPTFTGMITLANSVTVDGFDMSTGATTAITSTGATAVAVNIGNITTSAAVNAVTLTNTTGTVTITGGTQTNSSAATFNVSGGSVNLTYSGGVSQGANAAMLSVTNGHTGTIAFNTGTLNATNGTGLQFDNADGTYNFLGTTTLNGGDASIDILNGSAGTFNFATTSGSIAITNPTGTAFNVGGTSNTANITYDGNITKNNAGLMVAIANHASGTISFPSGNTLSATTASTGNGIQFDNADGTYTFNGVTTLAGGNAHLEILAGSDAANGSQGTFNFTSTTAADKIENPSGGVLIKVTGSIATLNYPGTLTRTGAAASHAIDVQNNKGGTITLSNATKTLTSTAAASVGTTELVYFNGNTGNTTLAFTNGGLNIASNANGGLFASNTNLANATLKVQGSNNVITATTGRALNVSNTTIGTPAATEAGLNFRTISASGGSTTAIYLDNVGTNGFTITGTGTTAGSGGIINGISGTDNVLTTGVGIYLNNISNVSLSNMNFTGNFGNFGIRGDAVNNFALKESNFTGVFGTSNNGAVYEGAIRFGTQGNDGTGNGLTGTVVFTGNTIGGGYSDNICIFNNSAGTMNMTVADGTNPAIFNHNGTDGNDAILIETRGPANGATFGHPGGVAGAGFNLTLSINGVEFKGARGDNIQTVAATNCTQNITITNNTFFNTHPNIVSGGGGITLSGGGATSNYIVSYNVSNNQLKGAKGTLLHVNYSGASAAVTGVIVSNTIGTPNGSYNSAQSQVGASDNGNGINVTSEKFGDNVSGPPHSTGVINHAVRIQNNTVVDVNGLAGIRISAGTQDEGGSLRLEASVLNNTVSEMGPFGYAAFYSVVGGASLTTDYSKVGLNIVGNTFNAGGAGATSSGNAMSFDQVSVNARYYFPGYAGSPNGESASSPGTASANLNTFMQDATRMNVLTNGPFPNPSAPAGSKVDATTVVGVLGSAFSLPVPLMVRSAVSPSSKVKASDFLTTSKAERLREAAIVRWIKAGATEEQVQSMRKVVISIEDIQGNFIGSSEEGHIKLDKDGAGYGWFFDETPDADEEFNNKQSDFNAKGKIDLLTVLMHELGHQIGMEDDYLHDGSSDLMHGYINPGERKLPVKPAKKRYE